MKFVIRGMVTAGILWAICNAAMGQTIEFNSMDRKQGFPALLNGRAQFTDKINGTFTRPAGATGNVPVMVIMHSSGGVAPVSTGEWSQFFLEMGVATFVVDSFGPRGIVTTTMDQSQLNYAASTADALNALKVVAAQPGVDPKRIGVIGFSRGALATATSSFENVRAAVLGADSPLRYSLHVVFYGGCTLIGTTTGAPMIFFVGKDDDFFSAESCTGAVTKLRARGANIVDFTVYPNATHSFDVTRAKTVYIANAQSFKGCAGAGQDLDNLTYYLGDTRVTSKEYGEYFGKCMTRGSSVGQNNAAKDDSRAKTKAFVLKNFAM